MSKLDEIELRAKTRPGWTETDDIYYLIARVRELESALSTLSDWVTDNHGCYAVSEHEGCQFCEEIHYRIRAALAGGA